MQEDISLAKWASLLKDLNYFLWILGTLTTLLLWHFNSQAQRTQPVGSSLSGEIILPALESGRLAALHQRDRRGTGRAGRGSLPVSGPAESGKAKR